MPCPYIIYFTHLLHVAHWLRHVQIASKLRLLIFLMTDQKYCRLFPGTATFVLLFESIIPLCPLSTSWAPLQHWRINPDSMKKQVIGCCIPAAVDAQHKFVCREHVKLDFSFTCRLQSAELEHLSLLFYLIILLTWHHICWCQVVFLADL